MSENNEDKYVSKAGKYLCKVKRPGNGWLDETKSGTPFIRIPCIVTEPALDQDGKEIVWRGYLSEKAKPRTVEALTKAFDWNGDWDDLNFEGIDVIIVAEEEEWNGETRVKAKWLNRLSNKAAEAKAAEIAARLKAEDGVTPAPAKQDKAPAKPADQELEDDDIPF